MIMISASCCPSLKKHDFAFDCKTRGDFLKTGAAYIRVSTEDQVELSPDSQLKMIEKYAKDNDIVLSKQYIYADEGISGRTVKKRPAFQQMIAIAKTKPKPFDVILVWKLSRFARNREDSIVYKSMLKKDCGIDVVSVSEPVGNDKTSILIEALLEAMDEYYSVNLAEEVRRGMTEKISRGGIVVAPPYGYKIENGIYEPEPEQSPIVQKIFADYIAGKGSLAIARELNELGIKTQRGNKFEARKITYILSNPTYIGKLRWSSDGKASKSHDYVPNENTIIVDGKHKPIIDKDTFDKAQELLAKNKSKYPKNYNQRKDDYFFRGIVRCSACGATLTHLSGNENSLQCYKYAHGTCKESHCITVSKLKAAVIEKMQADAENPNFRPTFEKSEKPKSAATQTDFIKEKINHEEMKLNRIKAAYEDGIDTLEEYKANKLKISAAIQKLNEKLQAELTKSGKENNEVDYAAFRNKLASVVDIISSADATPQQFNDALLSVTSKIVFDRKKTQIDIFYSN